MAGRGMGIATRGGGAVVSGPRNKKLSTPSTKVEVMMAKGGMANKKGKFPDLTGDGKVTQADILKGRGVKKMMGGGMAKKKGPVKGMKGGGMAKKKGPVKGMKGGGMAKKKGPVKGMKGGGMAKKKGPIKVKTMRGGGMAKKKGPMKKKMM